ncbi:MAG: hypothetical protein D6736_04295 [Nitrospinota bacterium]|nr:MAG: hypothetical protein D6736_04295 [Nitrospinota bacterium]
MGIVLYLVLFLGLIPSLSAAPSPPSITAKAAILIDAGTQEELFARNPALRLPMASTTKVMTALLALEKVDLQQKVRVSKHAASIPPSKIYLRPGEVLTVEDLLYAILLSSANDASVALAEALAGSERRFARLMTRRAHSLGAISTRFSNASGLPAPNHYSTVRDLALLMQHAVSHPEFDRIARTKTHTIKRRPGLKRYLRNHNKLLWFFPGAGSGKTGYTRAAGHCFVGTATRYDHTLIVAVLKSRSLWRDVRRLLEYGFQVITHRSNLGLVAGREDEEDSAASGEGAQSEEDDAALYTLQVGAFRNQQRAERLRDRLKRAGYDAYIVQRTFSDGTWYRVRLGAYPDVEAAREFAQGIGLERQAIVVPLKN